MAQSGHRPLCLQTRSLHNFEIGLQDRIHIIAKTALIKKKTIMQFNVNAVWRVTLFHTDLFNVNRSMSGMKINTPIHVILMDRLHLDHPAMQAPC